MNYLHKTYNKTDLQTWENNIDNKLKMIIIMKNFSLHATSLIVRYIDKDDEKVEWEIDELPFANFEAETIGDSENNDEYISDDENYKAVIYVNTTEGNIQLFNNITDEEIYDFEIEEVFDSEDEEFGDENE